MIFAILSCAIPADSVVDTIPAQVVQCNYNMQIGGNFESEYEAAYSYIRIELITVITECFWHFLPFLFKNTTVIKNIFVSCLLHDT